MTNKRETPTKGGERINDYIDNNSKIDPQDQDSWEHISAPLSRILSSLTPEQKAEEEQSDVALLFQVLLVPHRRSLKRVILLKLHQHGVLDSSQVSYFFGIFNLEEV